MPKTPVNNPDEFIEKNFKKSRTKLVREKVVREILDFLDGSEGEPLADQPANYYRVLIDELVCESRAETKFRDRMIEVAATAIAAVQNTKEEGK